MNYNIARSLGLFQATDISKAERRARGAGGREGRANWRAKARGMKAKEGETARKREGACSGPGVVSRADVSLRERVTRARGGGGGRGSLGETRSTRSGNLRRICSYLSARGAAIHGHSHAL